MARPPLLITTSDSNGFPISAKCSICDAELLLGVPKDGYEEVMKWTKANFDVHIFEKHPSRADLRRKREGSVRGPSA